jgi:tetratricopeptide (TPR) repeat protein
MQSTLPGLREEAESSNGSLGGAEFDQAMLALRAGRKLRDPRLLAAERYLHAGHVNDAKRVLSKALSRRPENSETLCLMAEIAGREGRENEAQLLLSRCVRSSPAVEFYRYNYVLALERVGKIDSALAETGILLEPSPRNLIFRTQKASLSKKAGNYAEAARCYRALTEEYPENAFLWNVLGEVLRDLGGHREECVAAFDRAAALAPWRGRIWLNLGNIKSFRFSAEHTARMEAALAEPAIPAENRAELRFALGRAYEDAADYRKSFENYSKGNAIRRIDIDYDPDSTSAMVSRIKAVFCANLFRDFAEAGSLSDEPIFVVGMQRSGSTLIEQILASHSEVEALGELNFLLLLVSDEVKPRCGGYPEGIGKLNPAELRALGEKYLAWVKTKRSTNKPFFVDKCPYNFWHTGLIRLILPNARIIDVRRHPLGCCFANFSTNFVLGPPLSYKQTEIARFHVDYVTLMAHFDRVRPEKIHRTDYEQVVQNLEAEVRLLLEKLGLPFEKSCLEYYKNERAFDSLSNDQVRNPIFRDGADRWRNYEPWLAPMKDTLGPVLAAWPRAPGSS